jgi:hypothetical protein
MRKCTVWLLLVALVLAFLTADVSAVIGPGSINPYNNRPSTGHKKTPTPSSVKHTSEIMDLI